MKRARVHARAWFTVSIRDQACCVDPTALWSNHSWLTPEGVDYSIYFRCNMYLHFERGSRHGGCHVVRRPPFSGRHRQLDSVHRRDSVDARVIVQNPLRVRRSLVKHTITGVVTLFRRTSGKLDQSGGALHAHVASI